MPVMSVTPIAASLALNAAINAGNVHPQSESAAIGIIVIYCVGFLAIAGLLLYIAFDSWRDRRRMREQERINAQYRQQQQREMLAEVKRIENRPKHPLNMFY
jgi:hypothetical protein